MKKSTITQKRLKEVLSYDPETGEFRWLDHRQKKKVHTVAGSLHHHGSITIHIDGVTYEAHRLVFLYITGVFPPANVRHINQDSRDNRYVNLKVHKPLNLLSDLTQADLKNILSYDKSSGNFTWLVSRSRLTKIGDIAGFLHSSGYVHIKIRNMSYKAHRLAFLYMDGYFPEHSVDHKNGLKSDNRWANLRHVTRSCNMQNRSVFKGSKSGFTGVYQGRSKGVWGARISVNKDKIFLGLHADKISAALARAHYEDCCPDWSCDHQAVNRVKLRELGYKV